MESCSPILTVREALELPIFAHATVVAGHAGLNNRIRWVHIIDIPIVLRDNGVLLVIESNDPTVGKQLASSIVEDLSYPASQILISLGSVCQPGENESISIRPSYEQAREAMRVGKWGFPHPLVLAKPPFRSIPCCEKSACVFLRHNRKP